jgi:RNA polymerase sigma factor (sigma-70 family)
MANRLERDDTQLIQACLAGEASAWNDLVERYGRLVYSIPAKLRFSAADADDVFQKVFAIVLRRLETLRDQRRLGAWLIRTTYRECWRHAKVYKQAAALDETLPADGEAAAEEVSRLEEQDLVRQALARIDERCRKLLTALFMMSEKPDYERISRDLGMPIGSIGPTRARCFQKMEAILRELGL